MQRRDYYFIAGGIFVVMVGLFLGIYFGMRKAKGQEALAQAIDTAPPTQPADFAHQAVASPQTGFITGGSQDG
jgi:hypothetical protein